MVRALEVEARDGRRIWLRYSDGATGEVDLSDRSQVGECSGLGTPRGSSKG